MFMDFTALQSLEHVIHLLAKHNVTILLCEANKTVQQKLTKAGIIDLVGEGHNFTTFDEALNYCELRFAENSEKMAVNER